MQRHPGLGVLGLQSGPADRQQVGDASECDRDWVDVNPKHVPDDSDDALCERDHGNLCRSQVSANGMEEEGAGPAGRIKKPCFKRPVNRSTDHGGGKPVRGVVLPEPVASVGR